MKKITVCIALLCCFYGQIIAQIPAIKVVIERDIQGTNGFVFVETDRLINPKDIEVQINQKRCEYGLPVAIDIPTKNGFIATQIPLDLYWAKLDNLLEGDSLEVNCKFKGNTVFVKKATIPFERKKNIILLEKENALIVRNYYQDSEEENQEELAKRETKDGSCRNLTIIKNDKKKIKKIKFKIRVLEPTLEKGRVTTKVKLRKMRVSVGFILKRTAAGKMHKIWSKKRIFKFKNKNYKVKTNMNIGDILIVGLAKGKFRYSQWCP